MKYDMKPYLYILFTIIFLNGNVGLLKAESDRASVEGFLKAGHKVMNIKDMVSIWSEDERILKLYLFPFELSEQDIQIVLGDSIYSYWIVRDSNPELSKWYNCPYHNLLAQ